MYFKSLLVIVFMSLFGSLGFAEKKIAGCESLYMSASCEAADRLIKAWSTSCAGWACAKDFTEKLASLSQLCGVMNGRAPAITAESPSPAQEVLDKFAEARKLIKNWTYTYRLDDPFQVAIVKKIEEEKKCVLID